MGGNALNHLNVRRISRYEYINYTKELSVLLKQYYKHHFIPHQFPAKESFGDIDVLVSSKIKEVDFESKGQVKNGNIKSMEYKGVQLDLINLTEREFEMGKFLYSWGEFGQLLGMNVIKFGFKTSQKGLYIRDPPFFLTTDPAQIMNFFDLDGKVYNKGFTSPTDVYNFFYASKYFKAVAMSIKGTYRDSVKEYIEHCENKRIKESIVCTEPLNKFDLISKSIDYFNKQEEYKANLEEIAINRKYKTLFNGSIVQDINHLEGKELGLFIHEFQKQHPKEDILKLERDEVVDLIKHFSKKL